MPDFNPDEYLAKNDPATAAATPTDTGFNPDAYLAKHEASDQFAQNREAIEPGVMGETEPVEQKLLNNATTALTGATLPSAAIGAVKGLAGLAGKGVEAIPGMGNTGEYLNRFAQNQAIKNLGTVRGQVTQLGPEKARQVADYYFEKGIGGPMTGTIGMEKNIKGLEQSVGGKLGDLRASVTEQHDMPSVIAQIRARLDPQILKGARAGETGTYQNALDEVAKLGNKASAADVAKTVTKLNSEAKNLNSLKMPSGAMADVAKELRGVNDNHILSHLSPEDAQVYTQSLGEYQKLKPLEAMEKRGEMREMTQRGGGPISAIGRKFMDVTGHKTLAEGAKGAYNQIQAPITQNLADVARGGVNLAAEDQNQKLHDYLTQLYGQ